MMLHEYVGRVIQDGTGRSIKVEATFSESLESFFLMRWLDTNEVFCEYPEKILLYLIGD